MNHSGCEEGAEQVCHSFKVGSQRMESLIKIDSSEASMSPENMGNNAAPSFSRDFIPEDSSLPSESLSSLEHDTQLILKLSQEVSSLKFQLDSERASRAREEDQLCLLIQAVTEAEAELDLLGRTYESYRSVLSQLIKATCCSETMSTKTSYSSSLTKIILTVYSNHMKALDMHERIERPCLTLRSASHPIDGYNSPFNDGRMSVRSSLERLDFDDDYVSDDAERCLSALARTEYEMDENEGGEEDVSRVSSPMRPFSAPSGLEIVPEEEDIEIDMQCDTLSEEENFDQGSQVNEVLENVLERVNDIVQSSPTQDFDPFESNFHKYKKVEPLRLLPNVEVVEGVLVEIVMSPTSPRSASIDSAIGSGNIDLCQSQNSREETTSNSSDNCGKQAENSMLVINEDQESSVSEQQLKLLAAKVDELNEAFKLQSRELSAAIDRVSQLEDKLSKTCCRGSGESNAIEDEIKAWKELVEQQKGVLEKITSELDVAKHELKERNCLIEQLIVEKEAALHERSVVNSIVAKREAQLKNHITKVSSGTQVSRDDEPEITCHNHTVPPMMEKDGFCSQQDEDRSVEVDLSKLDERQEKRDETAEWIQLNNDDDHPEEDEDHPSLEQMDLLSFSYLNSPCRRKIENSSQRKIQFLETVHEPEYPCDQVSTIHRFNSYPAKKNDTLPSNEKFFHSEHVLNAPESPEHLKSKFLSRPDHIPTHPLPFTASSSSTVTENPALTVLGYESSLDGHRTSLGVDDNGTRSSSNNEVSEERDLKSNRESEKSTSLHDYCTQVLDSGSRKHQPPPSFIYSQM